METILQVSAPVLGLLLGTFLFTRVGSWIAAILAALKDPADGTAPAPRAGASAALVVALLNSGPWLLAGVICWAYYVLSEAHALAWEWFFGAVAAAIPIWLVISLYLYRRGKRMQAQQGNGQNAI